MPCLGRRPGPLRYIEDILGEAISVWRQISTVKLYRIFRLSFSGETRLRSMALKVDR